MEWTQQENSNIGVRRISDEETPLGQRLGGDLKPVLMAGLAVAALATAAGVTIAVARRRRANRWLPPEPPSALGKAARGAGLFLLRFVARQVASQLVAKLEGAPAASPTGLAAAAPPAAFSNAGAR